MSMFIMILLTFLTCFYPNRYTITIIGYLLKQVYIMKYGLQDKEEDDERPQAKKVKRQLVSQFSSSSQIGDANIVPPTPPLKVISFLSKKETQDPEWIPPSNPTPGPRKLMTEEEEMTVESRVRNVCSHNKGRPEQQTYQQLMKRVYESMGTEFTNQKSRKQFMDRCRHQHYKEKYFLA
eukprot:XP_011672957.1 PREDICTED: uncharacterized protein LOC105442493 isoform X2 [Strongylocentrotus purpuratus]